MPHPDALRCAPALAWGAAGALLGGLAWQPGQAPVLAAAMPLLLAWAPSRAGAGLAGAGYATAVLRFAPPAIATWFAAPPAAGLALAGACAALGGVVGAMGWSSSPQPVRRASATALAWAAGLLPPMALAVPGHPLVAWGWVWPGSGWWGVAASALVPAAAVAMAPAGGKAVPGLLLMLILLLAGSLRQAPPADAPPQAPGLVAFKTHWGRLQGPDAALARLTESGRWVRALPAPPPRALAWPESIVGPFADALAPVLEIELLAPARQRGQVVVLGLDLPAGPPSAGAWRSAARAFYPDGGVGTAWARQPAPLALWRPWAADGFLSDWGASAVLQLAPGQRAGVVFCFEEYLPVLWLLTEWRHAPQMMLVLANTWAAVDRHADALQALHSQGLARLFARPYARAVNGP